MSNDSLNARVGILENGLMRLEASVERIGAMMAKQMEESARAPRVMPLKEILVAVGATLTVFYGILRFIDERVDIGVRDSKTMLELHERELQRIRPLIYSHQRNNEAK